jgi:hypothetical protein
MDDDYSVALGNAFSNPIQYAGMGAAEILSGQSNLNSFSGSAGNQGTNNSPEVLRYPLSKIEAATDYFTIQLFDYESSDDVFGLTKNDGILSIGGGKGDKIETELGNPGNGGSKLITGLQTIALPMPQNISDAMSVGYAEDSLNPLQVAGLNLGMGLIKGADGKELPATVENIFTEMKRAGGIKDDKTIDAFKSVVTAKAINQLGANVNPQSVITRASGQILQSNLELLFNNVSLRSFSFAFDFAPRNRNESEMVARIIRTIKEGMSARKGENPAVFIKSPKIAKLAYMKGSQAHPFLNKMKSGFITDMSVNYTGSNTYATYNDGTPVHMRMQFTFKEMNPIYADDYASDGELGNAVGGGVGY